MDWDSLANPFDILDALSVQFIDEILIFSTEDEESAISGISKEQIDKIVFEQLEDSSLAALRSHLEWTHWAFNRVFITQSRDRITVANSVAVGTILIKSKPTVDDCKTGADFVVTEDQLKNLSENRFYGGLLGEVGSFPSPALLPQFRLRQGPERFLYEFQCAHKFFKKAYSLGRWLGAEDPYRDGHHYTRFVSSLKAHPRTHKDRVGSILKIAIDKIVSAEKLVEYYLTWVPPKIDEKTDRNSVFLSDLSSNKKPLVRVTRAYKPQKEMETYGDREANIRGVHTCPYQLEGVPVILVDDVYTSGHTMNDCARALIQAGASRVVPVTIALACKVPAMHQVAGLPCKCGAMLQVCFNKDNANCFWGCPDYRNKSKAHVTYPFAQGLSLLRNLRKEADI